MNAYKELFNAVIAELNGDIYTMENANRIFSRNVSWDEKRKWATNKYGDGGWTCSGGLRGYDFNCVFGCFYFESLTNGIKLEKMLKKGRDHIKCSNWRWRGKCGIEVIGMKPQRTKDGKYSWKGLIITELKAACKKNGIKKYSKMDKCELVIALMKC
jgi:hypothetical protein